MTIQPTVRRRELATSNTRQQDGSLDRSDDRIHPREPGLLRRTDSPPATTRVHLSEGLPAHSAWPDSRVAAVEPLCSPEPWPRWWSPGSRLASSRYPSPGIKRESRVLKERFRLLGCCHSGCSPKPRSGSREGGTSSAKQTGRSIEVISARAACHPILARRIRSGIWWCAGE